MATTTECCDLCFNVLSLDEQAGILRDIARGYLCDKCRTYIDATPEPQRTLFICIVKRIGDLLRAGHETSER